MEKIAKFSILIYLLYIINFLFSVIDIVLEKFFNMSEKDYNIYHIGYQKCYGSQRWEKIKIKQKNWRTE